MVLLFRAALLLEVNYCIVALLAKSSQLAWLGRILTEILSESFSQKFAFVTAKNLYKSRVVDQKLLLYTVPRYLFRSVADFQ
jgi:hypothetical protein